MRISVVHTTTYRYSNPVYLEPQIIRLRPRVDGTQHLIHYSLEIDPAPAGRSQVLDHEGNVVTHAWFGAVTSQLTLRNTFEVETLRANPFDFLLLENDREVPVMYAESLRAPLVPYLRTDHHPDVRAFAQQVAQKADWNTLRFLGELNRNLFEGTNHVVRQTGAPLGPAETLTSREGSCRDTAVLFCATCRAMGIAARFVSGYELGSAMQSGSGDLHAWAEVYLQGGGWRGYDPSRGLAVADGHIPIAAASDASLAAPVTGTFRGQAQTTMDFQIAMQLL